MSLCLLYLVPLCVCVMSNKNTSKIHVTFVKPLVNLTPCCINYTRSCCKYLSAKAQQIKSIIAKETLVSKCKLGVTQLHDQLRKQDK